MTAPADTPDKPFAVALTYARDNDEAPRVVAKGHGEIAAAIERIAEAHGIPIRKDASLASLLAAVELDSLIPVEAYVAVAQILSYIYQRPGGSGGQHPR
jgi:flagellar biosynthesis protein